MTDIVLVNPPLLWGQEDRLDIKPPLNLLYLGTWLKHRGISLEIIDVVSTGMPLPKVLERLETVHPRFVGVPFYQGSRETAMQLCQALKTRLPATIIVGGGPLMTTSFGDLLREPSLDVGVIGEGERTLEELVRAEPTATAWAQVPGLAWRGSDGTIVTSIPRDPFEPLDELPYLEYDLIDPKPYYDFQERLGMPKWLFLSSSRGCPFKCVYCATPVLWPGKLRRLSIPRLLAEIRHQRSKDPAIGIGFMDDSFFSDKPWLHEFFRAIESEKVRYCCIGRADHLTPADVAELARTGCHYVALGVETGNQERQKKIRKYLDLSKVRAAVRALAEHRILSKCFFMLGFPGETLDEMVETINFAVALKREGMDECNIFPVQAYPGTELAKGLPPEAFRSEIYEHFDRANRPISELRAEENLGEKRLSIYASVPTGDLNQWLDHRQLLELVKIAYNKVEVRQEITRSEIEALQSKVPG